MCFNNPWASIPQCMGKEQPHQGVVIKTLNHVGFALGRGRVLLAKNEMSISSGCLIMANKVKYGIMWSVRGSTF